MERDNARTPKLAKTGYDDVELTLRLTFIDAASHMVKYHTYILPSIHNFGYFSPICL
jgi:hypothetical protein